jgi:hypothetical protein
MTQMCPEKCVGSNESARQLFRSAQENDQAVMTAAHTSYAGLPDLESSQALWQQISQRPCWNRQGLTSRQVLIYGRT